jgi:hypothetical protein
MQPRAPVERGRSACCPKSLPRAKGRHSLVFAANRYFDVQRGHVSPGFYVPPKCTVAMARLEVQFQKVQAFCTRVVRGVLPYCENRVQFEAT